jgi:hypothetical protein
MSTPRNFPNALSFDWGVPNVSVPLPSCRYPPPLQPRPLNDLDFTPVGIYDVRRHFGADYPECNRLHSRYIASDMVFLVAGALG